jgi:hypothetical protein
MSTTTEQLAALREVARRTINSNNESVIGRFETAFDPTTCLELLEEVVRLRNENEILRNADYSFLQKENEP